MNTTLKNVLVCSTRVTTYLQGYDGIAKGFLHISYSFVFVLIKVADHDCMEEILFKARGCSVGTPVGFDTKRFRVRFQRHIRSMETAHGLSFSHQHMLIKVFLEGGSYEVHIASTFLNHRLQLSQADFQGKSVLLLIFLESFFFCYIYL